MHESLDEFKFRQICNRVKVLDHGGESSDH